MELANGPQKLPSQVCKSESRLRGHIRCVSLSAPNFPSLSYNSLNSNNSNDQSLQPFWWSPIHCVLTVVDTRNARSICRLLLINGSSLRTSDVCCFLFALFMCLLTHVVFNSLFPTPQFQLDSKERLLIKSVSAQGV